MHKGFENFQHVKIRIRRSSRIIGACLVTLRRFENSRDIEITATSLHAAGVETSILKNNRAKIGSALGEPAGSESPDSGSALGKY
jgi:hypothetical protein